MIKMRKLGIDYGDSRVGLAITDELGITAQGLETVHHKGNDKIVLKRLEEIMQEYEIDTFVIGMPINMNGTKTERAEVTNKFIHKLKCKFNKVQIVEIDERLTTVAAHKTMNFLNIDKYKKKDLVDTISAVYILEMYINRKNQNNKFITYRLQTETKKSKQKFNFRINYFQRFGLKKFYQYMFYKITNNKSNNSIRF